MLSPLARTMLGLCLAAGLPASAQMAETGQAGQTAQTAQAAQTAAAAKTAPAVDAPAELPLLVWEDAVGVATSPWRCSPEDWTQVGFAAAAVVGAAVLLDHPVQRALQRGNHPGLHHLADDLAPIGNEYSFLLAAGFYGVGYFGKDGEAQAAGADALSSLIVASAVLVPFKYGAGRATPSESSSNTAFKPFSSQDSFPSGHTTWAFSAAAAFTEHYSEPWMQVTAYGLATLVGMARLEQNQHWTSDVLAGALLGTTIGKLVTRLNQKKRFGNQGQYQFTMEPQLGLGYQGLRASLTF